MSDRKYRQRGYQDDARERPPNAGQKSQTPREPYDPRIPRDPRAPNLPGFRQVFRCGRCGHIESTDVGSMSKCGKCGVALRACVHCESFDPGARFECRQRISKRVSPKDEANDCPHFAPRLKVERETGSQRAADAPSAAKKALDDLFKF